MLSAAAGNRRISNAQRQRTQLKNFWNKSEKERQSREQTQVNLCVFVEC